MRLAIIGGMGPMAGIRFHQIVSELTAGPSDQENIDIIHYSMPSSISDRTGYLLGETPVNPSTGVNHIVDMAVEAQATHIAIPCNTCHSPAIWADINRHINNCNYSVVLVSMMHCLLDHLSSVLKSESVGVMATSGSRKACVFDHTLKGLDLIYPEDEYQQVLHDSIYNPEWGIKSKFFDTEKVRLNLNGVIEHLKLKGVDHVILGCTELPIVLPVGLYQGVSLIDPATLMAEQLKTTLG